MAILTIGILTVTMMQGRAMLASAVAYDRTEANNIAIALIETLQHIPFNDPSLAATVSTPGELANDANAHTYASDSLPDMLDALIEIPPGSPAGTIVDRSGIRYTLSWAVQDAADNEGNPINKTIRIFMFWDTPAGQNRLEFTTTKYSNVAL